MSYNFDYGFDVNTLTDINIPEKEYVHELEENISRSNEYYEGEKEAIKKWLKEHKKVS